MKNKIFKILRLLVLVLFILCGFVSMDYTNVSILFFLLAFLMSLTFKSVRKEIKVTVKFVFEKPKQALAVFAGIIALTALLIGPIIKASEYIDGKSKSKSKNTTTHYSEKDNGQKKKAGQKKTGKKNGW